MSRRAHIDKEFVTISETAVPERYWEELSVWVREFKPDFYSTFLRHTYNSYF
jgi:hypothetical protein